MNQVFKVKLAQVDTFFRRIDTVDQCRIYIFKDFIGLLENIHVGYLIRDIIFAKQTDGAGFHAQVHILSHQDRLHIRIFGGQVLSRRQNQMVGFLDRERVPHFGSFHLTGHHEQTSQAFAQFHSVSEKFVTGQHVQFAYKLTGIEIDLLVPFLELVQFFEYNKREIDIIFLKILQTITVVKNNICV